MYYNIDAHELRAQAFLQAFKDVSAWAKRTVGAIKNQLHTPTGFGHTA